MVKIPPPLLQQVEATITRYDLFRSGKRVAVAASGGKDSTCLLLILRELGYEVDPLVVDMGYSSGWGETVDRQLRGLGFRPLVLSADNRAQLTGLSASEWDRLQDSLGELRQLAPGGATTPCTRCYNVKATALFSALTTAQGATLAFGHHQTDALSSTIKSGLLYIDRWDRGNCIFERDRFRRLAESAAGEFESQGRSSPLLRRLQALVGERCAGTDEPPRQSAVLGARQLDLVRPLFAVDEADIEIATARLTTQPSGCGHSLAIEHRTPREVVHWSIVRRLSESPTGRDVLSVISEAISSTLLPSGEVPVLVRAERAHLLGAQYKGSDVKL